MSPRATKISHIKFIPAGSVSPHEDSSSSHRHLSQNCSAAEERNPYSEVGNQVSL